MIPIKKYIALGLISGSSLDGVDAAIIKTDGVDVFEVIKNIKIPYNDDLLNDLRDFDIAKKEQIEDDLTRFHADVVGEILSYCDSHIDVIGFFGHTICHNPRTKEFVHIGNAKLLSELTSIQVVANFQKADILAGGQGEPLTAVYHQAMVESQNKPIAVINIGGISTLSFIGSCGSLMSFDSGPGNAIINDWVYKKANMNMDYNGKMAVYGNVDEKLLSILLKKAYFTKTPPKIIIAEKLNDKMQNLDGLSMEDGAATATALIVQSIKKSIEDFLPEQPERLVVCGGGAKNPTLLRMLKKSLEDIDVIVSDDIGYDAEYIEAQAMAYLAVRRLNSLPSTYATTTGCQEPTICGDIL